MPRSLFRRVILIRQKDKVLIEAGYTLDQLSKLKFFGTILGGIILPTLMVFAGLNSILLILSIFIGAFIGWLIPEIYLIERQKMRQFELHSAVPELLDQLHMIVASPGFESFGQALRQLAPHFPGVMGEELLSLTNFQSYLTQQELLDRLVERCPHPLLKELRVTLQLTQEYGGSLQYKTAEIAERAITDRDQKIKELGNKASGMLLGPLLIFHLPALLIIFLIPFVFILQKGL